VGTDHSSIRLTCENVVDTERVAMLVSMLEGSRCKNLPGMEEKFVEDLSRLGRCEIVAARPGSNYYCLAAAM
jgi:hypothetical protein